MVSVAANSPSLPKAITLCHFGTRFPFASVAIFPALLGSETEHGEVRGAVAGCFDFGVFSDETDEIDCVLKHVRFLFYPSVGHPDSEWVPLPRPRSEFFWRVPIKIVRLRKTEASIVMGNRNPEGRELTRKAAGRGVSNPEAVPTEGSIRK